MYRHRHIHTCSMETVQQNGRFILFSSKFPSNIYSILYDCVRLVCTIWPALDPDPGADTA